jgi:hypothetical protein
MHGRITESAIPGVLSWGTGVHVPGAWPVDTGQSGAHRT